MSRLANLLVSLTIVSGLYALLSESWNVVYRWNLILHPFLGAATTFVLVVYAARHIKDKLKGEVPVSPGRIALLLGAPVAGALAGQGLGGARWVPFAVVAAALVGPLRRIGRFVMRRLRHAPAVLLGGASLGLWAAATTTGVPLFALDGAPVAHGTVVLHRTVGLVAAAVYVTHLLFIRVYRAERLPSAGAERAALDLREALRAAGLATAVLLVGVAFERLAPRPAFDLVLFRVPGDGHPARPEVPLTGRDARALDVSESCASEGCHPSVVDDYQHSTHRLSTHTGHFQKTVALLESERGPNDTLVCGGCHFPLALVTDEADFRAYAKRDAITCMACHGIQGVGFDEADPRRSTIRFEPPLPHLRMFVDEDGREGLSPLDLHLVRMNPIGHGRAMRAAHQDENELCQACHHNEIHESVNEGFELPRCRDCHMQPPSMLGRPGEEANHVFPGANTAVLAAAGRPDSVALVQGFLSNQFELYIPNWGSAWYLRGEGHGSDPHRAIYLRMKAEIEGDTLPGSDVTLAVTTTNVGIEHGFPAAPMDLIDAWLYAKVTDAAGRVLLESGTIDERGHIDPSAIRLGGRQVDHDGLDITQHRVWAVKEEIVERSIENGSDEHIVQRLSFRIPADVAPGDLRIHARWNYRKLRQDFADWAYGPGVFQAPVTPVESVDATWQLGRRAAPTAAAARPPAGAPPPPAG